MKLSKEEKVVVSHALSEKMDRAEKALINKMENCSFKGYQPPFYGVIADEGISAKDILHRPAMQQLLMDAKDKKFDIILVWKLTRFSRNMADLMITCEMLDKLGIGLVSYSEAFDSSTPAGRMVRSMLGTVAQFEREVISENTKLGMLERAKQGKRTCSQVIGYDCKGADGLKINSQEADYVKFVFENYLIHKNLSEVAELCRKKGCQGKRGRAPTSWSLT